MGVDQDSETSLLRDAHALLREWDDAAGDALGPLLVAFNCGVRGSWDSAQALRDLREKSMEWMAKERRLHGHSFGGQLGRYPDRDNDGSLGDA